MMVKFDKVTDQIVNTLELLLININTQLIIFAIIHNQDIP